MTKNNFSIIKVKDLAGAFRRLGLALTIAKENHPNFFKKDVLYSKEKK